MQVFRHVLSLSLFLFLSVPPAFAYQQLEFTREISDEGKKNKERLFHEPQAVAVSGDLLYIADTDAHRVVVMDRSGKLVRAWGQKGSKQGQLREPGGIAVDEKGVVYVSDTGNNRIQAFTEYGKWLRSFGEKGSGPLAFKEPAGIAASRGIVYVADPGNSRVQLVTVDGIFLGQLVVKTKKDEMQEPVDVAVDVQNRIYVLDSGSASVRVFDPTGRQILLFGAKGSGTDGFDEPHGIAVDDQGNIFVTDSGNHRLKKFDLQGRLLGCSGSEGDAPGQFQKPAGIDIDQRGVIVVLDAEKQTLQSFTCERKRCPFPCSRLTAARAGARP
jgi:DNA-binding beta-propeller fold protein YncE